MTSTLHVVKLVTLPCKVADVRRSRSVVVASHVALVAVLVSSLSVVDGNVVVVVAVALALEWFTTPNTDVDDVLERQRKSRFVECGRVQG